MTIFSHVAKSFLNDALAAQIKSSIEKDAPRAIVVSFFIPERDNELARIKREFLLGLKNSISTLPEGDNDLAVKRGLLLSLRGCKREVAAEALSKNYAPGSTEALLEHLDKFVTSFHKKCESLLLTDQPHDEDVFAHYSIVVASYHAKRIIDSKTQASLFQSAIENPSLTPIIAFQKKLDNIVNTNYVDARRNLERQDQTEATHYMRVKNELGVLCIEFLKLKLDNMLSEYSLSIYAPFLPHYLNEYLNDAQRATQSHSSSTSFTEDVDDDDDFILYATSASTDAILQEGHPLGRDNEDSDNVTRTDSSKVH